MVASTSDPLYADESGGLSVKLPHQLGRFTLCRELGAGGMATVYLGRMRMTQGFDRLVALKTIHGHLAKAQTFVDMFLDEARIASQISHPNVCSVYDFGNIGGTYYLALEYLIGEPLFELVNQVAARKNDTLMQALPYVAARVLADACEGLHAAHETRSSDGRKLDIVHRDVSPQNLFITYDGSVKVVDFGCAKAIARVTQTDTGIMKGKVSYAAPEQLRVGELDARVDVWALGVCLWETLTLQDLFRRDTAIMSAIAVMEEPIPRADAVAPWVPRQLADIAEKALTRPPEERYPSARAMGRDLRAFIARAGVSFESAELAEWMTYLFADHQREVLAMVAEVEDGALARAESARSEANAQLGLGDAATRLAKVPSGPTAVPAQAWFEQAPSSKEDPPEVASAVDGAAEARSEEGRLSQDRNTLPGKPKRALRLDPDPDEDPVVLPTRGRAWIWITLALLLVAGGVLAALRFDIVELGGEPARATAAGRTVAPERPEPDEVPAPPEEPATEPDEPALAAPEPPSSEATPEPAPVVEAAPDVEAPATPERRSERAEPRARSALTVAPAPEPPREPAPAPAVDVSQGQVEITTEGGWAQVFHDDRLLGRTPLRVSLPVGRQQLRLLPYGREPAQHAVVPVEWGAVNRITLRIAPAPSAPEPDEADPDPEGG